MIPKIIHYCWFGPKEMPQKHIEYIKGWQDILPDYKFVKWNEENSPLDIPYMQHAYNNKKWTNLSNYIRLSALYEHGGIYLDTDVEVVKSFNPLLENKFFIGFEVVHADWDGCVNNAISGSVSHYPFIKELKERYVKEFDGLEEAHLSGPNFITKILKKKA